MKITLKVFAIIGIVLGGFAILASFVEPDEESIYAFIGGGLFLTQGIISLLYINEVEKGKK